jgi:hypothetical protein
VNSFAVAVLTATSLAGCGNYSTEDIRFLSALPRKEDLRVVVPAAAPPATGLMNALSSCAAPGEAIIWADGKKTSDGLNAGVDLVVGLIDNVRRYPPTARHDDSRRWGPFDDDKHPGREIQIVIDRSWPAGHDGPPTYAYRFQGRVKGTDGWTELISGTFVGPSASHGDGTVSLFFQEFWNLGMYDTDTPHGTMTIAYTRTSDPVTIELDLRSAPAGGFGVVAFNYLYAGFASGVGEFDFKLRNGLGDLLVVATGYDAAGAGRLRVTFTRASDSLVGTFDQCWDAGGCLVYVRDPLDLSCPVAARPCSMGPVSACAPLPVGVGPLPF